MRPWASGVRIAAVLLALLAGAACQLHERTLLPWSTYGAAGAIAALLLVAARFGRHFAWRRTDVAATAAAAWQATDRLGEALPRELEGRDLVVTGVVDRYRERGIAIVATPACEARQWIAAGPAKGRCEREAARRYWCDTVAAAGRQGTWRGLCYPRSTEA